MLVFCIIFLRVTMGGFIFYSLASFAILNYLAYQWVNTSKGIRGIIQENFSITGAPRVLGGEKISASPWGTWGLIAANVFTWFFVQTDGAEAFINNNLICLPLDPNLLNVPLSLVTSAYLHGSIMHLYGNMCFLWAVGQVVERRVGSGAFLRMYHLTAVASSLAQVVIHGLFMDQAVHGLGASGAISGVMGVFLVRCYFKKMTFPLPTLGFLPFGLNLQVNGLVVMGLFFTLDLRGGLFQISGASDSNVGHWAHLGGFVSGALWAWKARLGGHAIEERHRDTGSAVLDGRTILTGAFDEAGGFAGAKKSLLIALEKDPDNPETLLGLARIGSHYAPSDEGRVFYRRVVPLLEKRSAAEAAEVFREYFSRYRELLEPGLQYRIAAQIYREGDLDQACRLLEMMADHADTPPELKARSLFMAAKLLERMGLHEAAVMYYGRFFGEHPGAEQAGVARQRAAALSSAMAAR